MMEVTGLTKVYGSHTAVDHLTFSLAEHHVFGFLGPNGAGKSTTMNMIAGCLAATEGAVRVNGRDLRREPLAVKREIGYLPEIPPLYPDLTPREYLRFVGQAKGLRKNELHRQVQSVMEHTQITSVQSRLIKNLSKGYRQRVGLAQAILGNPSIILLDEPTVGLDPLQITEIRALIRELGRQHTVLFSSHILPEVASLCDHVMILFQGKLLANCSMEELTRQESLEEVFLRLTGHRSEEGGLS